MERQEAKNMRKKVFRRTANTHSQQKHRVHKKKREIQSGIRDSDGKIKKVIGSCSYHVTPECADLQIRNGRPL